MIGGKAMIQVMTVDLLVNINTLHIERVDGEKNSIIKISNGLGQYMNLHLDNKDLEKFVDTFDNAIYEDTFKSVEDELIKLRQEVADLTESLEHYRGY